VDAVDGQATQAAAAPRTSMFKFPNIIEDVRALPEMFRTKPTLWIPFAALIAAFVVALGMPYSNVDGGIASILILVFQMAFLPNGLIIYFVGGFLAPRAAYLVGLLIGLLNTALLVAFFFIRGNEILAQQGTDQPPTTAGDILPVYIGYAIFIGPLAAAFAAWYRSFLNRMNANSAQRRNDRAAEAARKKRDAARAAKRAAKTPTTTKAGATDTKPTT